MNKFAVAQARSFEEASTLVLDKKYKLPVIKAGGMDVVDLLKEGLIEPDLLINIKRVGLQTGKPNIERGLTREFPPHIDIQAMTTLAEIVESDILKQDVPVLSQSLKHAATPQVRNVGTVAGNLLQRPRCWYYRNEQFDCLKKGGSTCFAVDGENQYHAIFGDGPCHIVHPSNLAPALFVCEGVLNLVGGSRKTLSLEDLYHMPDKGIRSESNLEPGEVITSITVRAYSTSGFYSIKEKQSFDWPVAMCAVVLHLDGDVIKTAKVCAGAVAPVPWPLPNVENALKGMSVNDDAALTKACAVSIEGAKPMSGNAYKLRLLPVAVKRAVLKAAKKGEEA